MANSAIWKLIQRFLSGKITREEEGVLTEWTNQDPANKELLKDIESIWELSPGEEFSVDVQEAWERFIHRKKQKQVNKISEPSNVGRIKPDNINTLLRAAAVILVILFTGFFAGEFLMQEEVKKEASQFYHMQDLTTSDGEKAQVTFSDGTKVILNAASSLRFPDKFGDSNRVVSLNGEAYFKVAHDPEHPFIVKVNGTEVKVLGTSFNIRGWNEDNNTDIAVREGKVSVKSGGIDSSQSEVVLTKGQATRILKGESPQPPQDVDVNNYLLWTDGGLHFDNVPLKQVLRHVERNYDVEISVEKDVSEVPFTTTFKKAELSEVLNVIAATMEMEYRKNGSKISFQ